jgi:predicted MPP superfamily phosphohydrolase
MTLFLITFVLLYGGIHLYIFSKARSAFLPGPWTCVFIAFFLLLMVLAPFLTRFSERAGLEGLATIVAYTGYTWLGFLFIFFCLSLLVDGGRLALYLTGLLSGRDFTSIIAAHRLYFLAASLCALSVTGYGYFEASQIRTERVMIKTDKLIGVSGILTIAQISDVHLGLTLGEGRLRKILGKVMEINPDILVSTGDLLDGDARSLDALTELFREVNPPFGKYAITGNHEYYAGLPDFLSFADKAGFKVLRGEAVTVGGTINIAGVDDVAGRFHPLFRGANERELLSGLSDRYFTLLMKHRPLVNKDGVGLFDLQLSGHTHRGQIFPFGYLVRLLFPFLSGYFDLGRGSHLYVSRGTGTWGPPVRFCAPPEVTEIELRRP